MRIRTRLLTAVKVMGKDKVGFESHEVGCHSILMGAVMALYLSHVPVLTIMIIGRWKSDAFLCYICTQVAMFSQNLTDKMLEVDSFFTMPDFHLAKEAADQKLSPSPVMNTTKNGPNRSWEIFNHTQLVACA